MESGRGNRHRVRPWWLGFVLAASVACGGCTEVLDFGTVCAPGIPRVNLQLFVPDPLGGAPCETTWNGVQVGVLTPEGAPTYVGVVMDPARRTSSGKAGLVTAGNPVPLLVTLNRADRPLAVWITSVDLTASSCGDLVQVDLTTVPTWRTPAEVEIPSDVVPDTPMADAYTWALEVWEGSLDEDEDGCVYVQESCRETLFDMQEASACPEP